MLVGMGCLFWSDAVLNVRQIIRGILRCTSSLGRPPWLFLSLFYVFVARRSYFILSEPTLNLGYLYLNFCLLPTSLFHYFFFLFFSLFFSRLTLDRSALVATNPVLSQSPSCLFFRLVPLSPRCVLDLTFSSLVLTRHFRRASWFSWAPVRNPSVVSKAN